MKSTKKEEYVKQYRVICDLQDEIMKERELLERTERKIARLYARKGIEQEKLTEMVSG